MTWICTAQTPSNHPGDHKSGVSSLQSAGRAPRADRVGAGAFTLVELLVVMSLVSLLVVLAQTSLFGTLGRHSFRSQVQGFISTIQMAASAAAENGRRYEVIIDPTEQSYLLREITSSDLSDVLEEEIIAQGSFGRNCRLSYVEFDDGDYTNDERAKFRVGRGGWTYGGKVVFLDESEQSYTVMVSRLNPIVELIEGDPVLMKPKGKDEVPFL
ncbi:MAG: prepilin-type N-terminal cleavage/methylation domain-containing protein [Phycisphaerales bacterium]